MGFGTFFASRDSHVTCTNDFGSTFKGIKVESTNMRFLRYMCILVFVLNGKWKPNLPGQNCVIIGYQNLSCLARDYRVF